jgi:hypothetical protein
MLAADPAGAYRIAVERLDISWRDFERISPLELAWRLWGERRRTNARTRRLAWAVSTLVSPHIAQSDRNKVSHSRLFMQATGGNLDEDEVLR